MIKTISKTIFIICLTFLSCKFENKKIELIDKVCVQKLPSDLYSVRDNEWEDNFLDSLWNSNADYKNNDIVFEKKHESNETSNQVYMNYMYHQKFIIQLNKYIWDKSEFNIHFINGNATVIEKIKKTVKIWEDNVGVKYRYNKDEEPDIVIGFQKDVGSWSYIGTESLKYYPSMNFSWLEPDIDDMEYHRVVLHEFGHALGFVHEHQNPTNNPIVWNDTIVYKYYRDLGWKDADIYDNIIKRYSKDEVNIETYDENSIMVYAFPSKHTKNDYSVDWNYNLSANDIKHAKSIYYNK